MRATARVAWSARFVGEVLFSFRSVGTPTGHLLKLRISAHPRECHQQNTDIETLRDDASTTHATTRGDMPRMPVSLALAQRSFQHREARSVPHIRLHLWKIQHKRNTLPKGRVLPRAWFWPRTPTEERDKRHRMPCFQVCQQVASNRPPGLSVTLRGRRWRGLHSLQCDAGPHHEWREFGSAMTACAPGATTPSSCDCGPRGENGGATIAIPPHRSPTRDH